MTTATYDREACITFLSRFLAGWYNTASAEFVEKEKFYRGRLEAKTDKEIEDAIGLAFTSALNASQKSIIRIKVSGGQRRYIYRARKAALPGLYRSGIKSPHRRGKSYPIHVAGS